MTSDTKRKATLALIRPHSKDNPLTRAELAKLLNTSDRYARRCVSELRASGIPICGTSDEAGYYFAQTEAERKRFYQNYEAPAWTIIRNSRAMQRSEEGQVSL